MLMLLRVIWHIIGITAFAAVVSMSLTGCGKPERGVPVSEVAQTSVTPTDQPLQFSGCLLHSAGGDTVINLRMVNTMERGYRKVLLFSGQRYFEMEFQSADSMNAAFDQIVHKMSEECGSSTL